MKTIPIFYACDNNFVKFTIVSLSSMIENASKEYNYDVHVLHTDIKPETQEAMFRLQNDNFKVTFDDVTDYLESIKEMMPLRDYYSKTTYYRLFIAEMFPELDKAIYIDSDTVVQGDISEFYEYDISEYDLGACHEQAMVQENVYGTYVEVCMGINRNAYFNAGVLLINCKRFRENNILERFIKLLGIYNFRVTQDEDYLNVLCKDHVKFLPQSWNMEVFGNIPDSPEGMNVIHYIMVAKPWHFHDCRWGDVFWSYTKKTEVYDEIKAILDNYTDEKRASDMESCDRLAALAVEETNRPDTYVARIRTKQDQGRVAILNKIAQYEREGIFDKDVEEDPPSREIQPDEVDYLGKKLSSRIQSKIAFGLARKFLNKIIDEKKMIVTDIKGAEYFSSLDSGAIITCNHFNAFDSFAIQLAYESAKQKNRKFYRIIKEGNYTSFPGFYGYLMRHCNTLPLSSSPKAMQQFTRSTGKLLQNGHFVLIYPEQSMWWNYRKPKPLKDGGFYLAAKYKVPVLPCFIIQRDSSIIGEDGFPVQEYTIHISKPIYPDENLNTSANTAAMRDENYRVWKEIYENAYGIPLKY
jgi:lipopolysaccharide biosynthesis glycosyltransferase/1-acyl-sn-glycerol-3-phosphate acyltransferase